MARGKPRLADSLHRLLQATVKQVGPLEAQLTQPGVEVDQQFCIAIAQLGRVVERDAGLVKHLLHLHPAPQLLFDTLCAPARRRGLAKYLAVAKRQRGAALAPPPVAILRPRF